MPPCVQPVSEQCWVGSLVVLVPPLLSCLLCLPGPLLQIYHELVITNIIMYATPLNCLTI